jgi:uncharacterized protein (TIGR01777 family)
MSAERKRRVAISGSTGLIGAALAQRLERAGYEVLPLVRRDARGRSEIAWDPGRGTIEASKLEGLDAVVHLAGESIADGRWTAERKARIRESRVRGTSLMATSLADLTSKPQAFLSASASGWYGDRGDERVDEGSSPGDGFLAGVCREWEAAAAPASAAGIRTVALRFGVILSKRGGALAKMRLPFSLGLGGPIGDGLQGFPWILLEDAAAAIQFLIASPASGPVNVTSPNPVPQREFARAFGRAIGRPAVVPLPALAVRALFGQMGVEALLSGAFVLPKVLERAGFVWDAPTIDRALELAVAV